MNEVVSRVHRDHLGERFVASLRLVHGPLELRGRGPAEKPHVALAEGGELSKRVVEVGLQIVKTVRPKVLVIAWQPRAIVRENHAKPKPTDQLGVGQMLRDMAYL